jgi:hypothetical protein
MTSRLPSLSPSDGVVTLRSLPRRFREAFDGRERRARAEVVGPDGVSPLDLLVDTVGSLSVLERALDQILTSDDAVLHAGVLEPRQREFDAAGGSHSVDDALADLAAVAPPFADKVDAVAADDWTRTGTLAGEGTPVTALEVLQEAVATATENLRAAERLMAG